VLLLHGIGASCEGYVLNSPSLSPGLILAETGRYDLWFLNIRGNTYSRFHSSKDADTEPSFWNFSFEEMGERDLITAIDYVLKVTERPSLSILAYSQGTTVVFHGMSMNPSYFKDKVNIFVALAPVITLKYSTEGFLKTMSEQINLQVAFDRANYFEIFPFRGEFNDNFNTLSSACIILPSLCTSSISLLAAVRPDLVNTEYLS
jgi:pimeloyl-ACP methyl ester carboxylesterase